MKLLEVVKTRFGPMLRVKPEYMDQVSPFYRFPCVSRNPQKRRRKQILLLNQIKP